MPIKTILGKYQPIKCLKSIFTDFTQDEGGIFSTQIEKLLRKLVEPEK